jgi:hypothetical protein
VLFGACGGAARAAAPSTYFPSLLPDKVGAYEFHRETAVEDQFKKPGSRAIVSEGRVFTVRDGDTVQGSIQVALFKPGVDNQDHRVQDGVQRGLGAAAGFRLVHYGVIHLLELDTAEQRVFLWFPPERNVMELFVMRKKFVNAESVVTAVIAHQRGLPA